MAGFGYGHGKLFRYVSSRDTFRFQPSVRAELNKLIMDRILYDGTSSVCEIFRRDVRTMFNEGYDCVRTRELVIIHAGRRFFSPVASGVTLG